MSSWGDFQDPSKDKNRSEHRAKKQEQINSIEEHSNDTGCSWGFGQPQESHEANEDGETNLSKFIVTYEKYLQDKQSIAKHTENHKQYANNPQKALQEWFENEPDQPEFKVKTDQPSDDRFICRLELPIGDHDFTLASEVHSRKKDAMEEVCLNGCRLLDECQLLYAWQQQYGTDGEDRDRKRRMNEANKEDDIELDRTITKKHCDTSSGSRGSLSTAKVDTYESLMAKWTMINMSLVQLKAKLVKLDLSVTQKQTSTNNGKSLGTNDKGGEEEEEEEEDEVDPLDAYMSSLGTKTELSMDEKIEKSRIKAQIVEHERQQSELSRLIELAKPKFRLDRLGSDSSSSTSTTARRCK